MTQTTLHVSAAAAGLCFSRTYPQPDRSDFTLVAQGVTDVIHNQPFTVCVSSFRDKPVHLSILTALGIALQSPAHTMTVGPASPGVNEAEQKGKNGNEETPNRDIVTT